MKFKEKGLLLMKKNIRFLINFHDFGKHCALSPFVLNTFLIKILVIATNYARVNKLSNKVNHSREKITTKSYAQPCLLKVYVSLLLQDYFQNYCKLYNCTLLQQLQYQSLGYK